MYGYRRNEQYHQAIKILINFFRKYCCSIKKRRNASAKKSKHKDLYRCKKKSYKQFIYNNCLKRFRIASRKYLM